MGHDRKAAAAMNERDRIIKRAEHRELVVDPEREQVSRARRHLDARDDLDAAAAPRGEVPKLERAPDVVMVSQRDDVEAGTLRRIEDLLDRGQAVPEIAV